MKKKEKDIYRYLSTENKEEAVLVMNKEGKKTKLSLYMYSVYGVVKEGHRGPRSPHGMWQQASGRVQTVQTVQSQYVTVWSEACTEITHVTSTVAFSSLHAE